MKYSPFFFLDRLIDFYFKICGLELNFIDLGDYKMEYWISKKDKPVIVLLHAFGPNGKYSWASQVNILSRKYKVLIPNLLYFGKSTMTNKSYHVMDQLAAVTSLLKQLKINSFSLGGTSYGGVIAFELLHTKKFKITNIFITNSPLKYTMDDVWDNIIEDFGVNKKSEVLIPLDYKQLKKLFNLSYYKKKYYPNFLFKDIFTELYTYQSKERRLLIDTFAEDQKYLNERNYKTDVPILLIWGEEDKLSPLKIALKFKKDMGDNVNLKVISKTAHTPHIERRSLFNKILLDFLSD